MNLAFLHGDGTNLLHPGRSHIFYPGICNRSGHTSDPQQIDENNYKMRVPSNTCRVTFCDDATNQVHEFEKIEEFERLLIWWSFSDLSRFRSVCNKTVKALRSDDGEHVVQDSDEFYCMRGLENWGGKECRERRTRIRRAVGLVIDAQKALRNEGIKDAFACSDVYHQHTADARIQAHVRGVQDEEATLWERIEEEVQGDGDEDSSNVPSARASETLGKKNNIPFDRIKRRRSSGEKMGRVGLSLKIFARKITASSAAA